MAQVIAVAGAAVPLVNLAGEAWRKIDDLRSSGKGRHNLVVGKPGPGDILLHEEKKRQGCEFGSWVSHIYRHNGDNTITAVVAEDNWDDDTGGDPKIIYGGLGQKHVEVKVTSRFGRGFDHTVYVYGKKKN